MTPHRRTIDLVSGHPLVAVVTTRGNVTAEEYMDIPRVEFEFPPEDHHPTVRRTPGCPKLFISRLRAVCSTRLTDFDGMSDTEMLRQPARILPRHESHQGGSGRAPSALRPRSSRLNHVATAMLISVEK